METTAGAKARGRGPSARLVESSAAVMWTWITSGGSPAVNAARTAREASMTEAAGVRDVRPEHGAHSGRVAADDGDLVSLTELLERQPATNPSTPAKPSERIT